LRIDVSRERRVEVYRIVKDGSSPRPSFFLMVALSTLIAAFGLVMNSTAIVIGAMLVAPLMMPIFGIGLGLLRGNPRLLLLSLRAEALGMALAVAAATVLGLFLPVYAPTSEMLSRTQPNLLDMAVAVFAGAAGAYALVDERISPSLPGVAIATAIVPPLANCGLCISLGAFGGAWGSFLLFFTNLLSILLVSAGIFYLAGMTGKFQEAKKQVARRFSVLVMGLLVVSLLLGHELVRIVRDRKARDRVTYILNQELGKFTIGNLQNLRMSEEDEGLAILASIRAPEAPTPSRIASIEQQIEDALQREVMLFVRTNVTQDVSAERRIPRAAVETLDGLRVREDTSSEAVKTQIASQIVREYLGQRLGLSLSRISLAAVGDITLVNMETTGYRALRSEEIVELENKLAEALEAKEALLMVLQQPAEIVLGNGRIRTELLIRRQPTTEERVAGRAGSMTATSWLDEHGFEMVGISVSVFDGEAHALIEVTGRDMLTQKQYQELNKAINDVVGKPVNLSVSTVPAIVWTPAGPKSLKDVLSDYGRRTKQEFQEETRQIIESAN
ncbi:MAG: TIGR00341 family protein, partial [Rhodospirillales bacterium]|nr:TIGR00341 family protein [Rhodospirillales bacterium]